MEVGEGGEEPNDGERQKRTYKTRPQVQILLSEMEKMICEGQRDRDIMAFFDLKERSYYYFKDKLYKQSLEMQKSRRTDEVVVFETKVLKDRLIKVYKHLDQRLTMINQDPRGNDNIADVAIAAFQIAKSILTLEMEGLRALSTINENKFLKYANRYYQTIPNQSPNNNENGDNGNTNILQP